MTHDILLPSKLKVVHEEAKKGTYEIEGLYPGYGHTLGNSLRRIILSSIPGSAMTTLRIQGVDHEFSTISGVREDVISFILNLKKVRFHSTSEEPQVINLKVKGPAQVTAADIVTSGQVEVMNPEQYLCEVTGKDELQVEITIENGIGFVTKDMRNKEKVAIGSILVDAAFTPIRKVGYEVEKMRVGDRTDYNKLIISVETDGSLTAREAVERSLSIMVQQCSAILDLYIEPKTVSPVREIANEAEVAQGDSESNASADGSEVDMESMNDTLKTRIDKLQVPTRIQNVLNQANIRTIGGLVRKTEADLLEIEGLGQKGINEIKEALQVFDITLKSE